MHTELLQAVSWLPSGPPYQSMHADEIYLFALDLEIHFMVIIHSAATALAAWLFL